VVYHDSGGSVENAGTWEQQRDFLSSLWRYAYIFTFLSLCSLGYCEYYNNFGFLLTSFLFHSHCKLGQLPKDNLWIIEHTHTHTHIRFTAFFVRDYPGEPVPEPIWILLKQGTVSGSGISWAICKSAPCPRQMTTPTLHHSVFAGRMPILSTVKSLKS